MRSINEFYPLLTKPFKAVITMHQKPDGDAMGSALGLFHFLQAIGHSPSVVSPTNWADFLKWMPGIERVIDFEQQQAKANQLIENADIIFCLDFNVLHRTKNMEQPLTKASAVKVLIDHHQEPQMAAFDYGVSDTGKSSTCEMVYDFIVESGYPDHLNIAMAECLYTGVMTDTGSFRFASAGASVHAMVSRLKATGMQHTRIHDLIYDNFLENRLRFIGHALLNRMEVLYEMNTCLMYITKGDLYRFNIKTGDTEGLVNYLLTIAGIKLGALVIDRDEERKWSFRSKGDFDVNTFARLHFEGGGHKNASGGRSSSSLEESIDTFKEVLIKYQQQLQ